MITLEELLDSRDRRAGRQRELLSLHPSCVLVCVTVIMPGPEKKNKFSHAIAAEAMPAARSLFSEIVFEEIRDLETGFEGYLLGPGDHLEIKRKAVGMEEHHPLGRLFDLDVIGSDGVPLSRAAVDAPQRRCLLCGLPARHCARARTHSTGELLAKIEDMLSGFQSVRDPGPSAPA